MKEPNDDVLAAVVAQPLTPFEGREVRRAAIEIPSAAGGLREALAFEPVELHQGQRIYVLLETEVHKVRFDPIMDRKDDTGASRRVHVLKVTDEGATFVDAKTATKMLDEQKTRIRKLREEAAGILTLPGTTGGDEGEGEPGE